MQTRPKMWEKQRDAAHFTIKRGRRGTGLFMEMGVGKTRVAITVLEKWMAEENVKLTLVVNTLTGLYVWVDQWHQWATYPIAFIDLHETGVEGLKKAVHLSRGGYPVICLINYEALWQLGHKRIKRMRGGEEVRVLEPVDIAVHDIDWDAVILDESTAIKSPSARVTKYVLRKIKPRARFRLALTGSAYTKRPLDVYTQLKFILTEGNKLIPQTFTKFKQRYAIPHPYIRGAVQGYYNIPDLVARMAQCCVMLKKEDVLDLPPVLHLPPRWIELPSKIRALYNEITDNCYAELEQFEKEGGTVTVNHLFAVRNKQMQITSGFLKVDPTEERPEGEIIELHDLKVQEVVNLLDLRAGKPTLVVTQFDQEERMLVRGIRKAMNFRPKVLNGAVQGAKNRFDMAQSASTDPVFIVKEAVAAKSIDLQWADMTIFYSHRAHTIDYEQMMARNHRGTQTKNISYVHLLCPDTVDVQTMRILKGDLNLAREIEKNWRALL